MVLATGRDGLGGPALPAFLQGLPRGWPDAKGVVCDIGGNSMELARIGATAKGGVCRLTLTDLDKQLLNFIGQRVSGGVVKLLVLLTKADKLNKREAQAALLAAQQRIAQEKGAPKEASDAARSIAAQVADAVAEEIIP